MARDACRLPFSPDRHVGTERDGFTFELVCHAGVILKKSSRGDDVVPRFSQGLANVDALDHGEPIRLLGQQHRRGHQNAGAM